MGRTREPILAVCSVNRGAGEPLELHVGAVEHRLWFTIDPTTGRTEILVAAYDAGKVLETMHFGGERISFRAWLQFEERPRSPVAADVSIHRIEGGMVLLQAHAIAERYELALLLSEDGAREFVRRMRSMAHQWPKSLRVALHEVFERIERHLRA